MLKISIYNNNFMLPFRFSVILHSCILNSCYKNLDPIFCVYKICSVLSINIYIYIYKFMFPIFIRYLLLINNNLLNASVQITTRVI